MFQRSRRLFYDVCKFLFGIEIFMNFSLQVFWVAFWAVMGLRNLFIPCLDAEKLVPFRDHTLILLTPKRKMSIYPHRRLGQETKRKKGLSRGLHSIKCNGRGETG